MNNQNSDISYGSSDEESQDFIPPRINNNRFDLNDDINETAVSFKEMNMQDNDDDCFYDAASYFQKFYSLQLIKKSQPICQFYNSSIFDNYKKIYQVYFPKPYLYFLPITILFDRKIEKLIDLRDKINSQFKERANVQIPKERPEEILVTIHDKKQMMSYVIRSNPMISKYNKHHMPQLLDPILSLNPLFQFYQVNFKKNKFSQTCGIFMYWAYLNRILSYDYLSESAIKIIVIVFYLINEGAPNVITQYIKENQKQLNRLQKLYKVNKKMECQLEPQLFGHNNFTIMQKRSFYQESARKFSTMTKILPIPYPVSKIDIESFSKSYQEKQSRISQGRQKPHFAVIKFFKIMQYLENCIKRSEKVVFDIRTRKGVSTTGDIDFSLQVKHPIFENNLCQKLMTDPSKLRILKQHIGNVISIYKKNKSRPMEALTKIFQRV